MMSKIPQVAPRHETADIAPDGLVVSAMSWVQQRICGLHGHDALLQYERNRIFLRCASCGHETPGWDLARAPGASHAEAHGTLHATDLATARKVA